MTRTLEIETAMLGEFIEQGIEDTTENRLDFLTGLKDGWKELPKPTDSGQALEKSMYMNTISMMITMLRIKLMLKNNIRTSL